MKTEDGGTIHTSRLQMSLWINKVQSLSVMLKLVLQIVRAFVRVTSSENKLREHDNTTHAGEYKFWCYEQHEQKF